MQAPGEALVLKLWDTLIDRGVGGLLRPWQVRRLGRAELDVRREELVLLAAAEAEAAAIRGRQIPASNSATSPVPVSSCGQLIPADVESPIGDVEPKRLFARSVTDAVLAEAARREINVSKAILVAESELLGQASDAADQADKPIEPDWLYRWRDAAGEVSAAELQHLWGRLLAGETRRPGSFSLRTLEYLRNLSAAEAEMIERVAPFVCGDLILREDDAVPGGQEIDFTFLLALQDIGIVSGVGGLGLEVTLKGRRPDGFERSFVVGNRIVIVKHSDREQQLTLPVFVVTRIGKEVLRLTKPQPVEAYLRALAIAAVERGFDAYIATGSPLADGKFLYSGAERVVSAPPAT